MNERGSAERQSLQQHEQWNSLNHLGHGHDLPQVAVGSSKESPHPPRRVLIRSLVWSKGSLPYGILLFFSSMLPK